MKKKRGAAAAAGADGGIESLFGSSALPDAGKGSAAEQRLRKELDEELSKNSQGGAPANKKRLSELGGAEANEETRDATGGTAEADDESSQSDEAPAQGFLGEGPKESKKKKKESKSSKKDSKKKKKDSKKNKSNKDKKKKKKAKSSSSSSSDSSDSSSSVFRVGKTGNDRISQARMIQWAEDHPGMVALKLLQTMKGIVGEDGEKVTKSDTAPAVAKQFDLRILKHQLGPQGRTDFRNQREMTNLCTILDHLALGRYKQAADVAAARLKSVEGANRDGHFNQSSFLELVPVNTEGLTTVDEKVLVRNESLLKEKSTPSSGDGWMNYGQGGKSHHPYSSWIPNGKGKGKKEGGKGKKGAKGKKGEGKKGKND